MMSFLEDLLPVFRTGQFGERIRDYSSSFLQNISLSMSTSSCGSHGEELEGSWDDSNAVILKTIAIAAILVAGICGVTIPLYGKKSRFLDADSNIFVTTKAFAAGVILATGFVHMLPDATSALSNPCLPKVPWSKFPFSGFIAMLAALATLLADFAGMQYYERKQQKRRQVVVQAESLDVEAESVETRGCNGKVFGEDESGAIHVVGMHAHAADRRHNHTHDQGACRGRLLMEESTHGIGGFDEHDGVRHIVVSQVLELGIVSHSVIIGLSLGVSHSPCTIRPLIGALSFHQFFEGFALGGCISQAEFRSLHSTLMACFFALTTPLGIAVGIGISSVYNPNSPRALVIEGVFDSISAGILVYMALVDLIAADFLSKQMSCNVRLQVLSYCTLFFGALMMSSLAAWA